MDRYSRFPWQSSEKLGRFGTLESTFVLERRMFVKNAFRRTANQREPETKNRRRLSVR